MSRDDLSILQTVLLFYIAAQFGVAWSTGDVLFALIGGGVLILGAWLGWKLLRVAYRSFVAVGGRPDRVLIALMVLAVVTVIVEGVGR